MWISAILGVLVGAILGLTGAGGGILGVPALVFGLHMTMQQAAPVALIAVATSAAVGAWDGLRQGLVRYRAAGLMALCGLPLSYAGQTVAAQLPQSLLLLGFSLVMIWVAVRMFGQRQQVPNDCDHLPDAMAKIHEDTGKFVWNLPTVVALSVTGALTGLMTGLLGVGGGFVIVPMLRKLTQVSMKGIVATSLMVIALVGSGSVLTAIARHVHMDAIPTATFTAATVLGMVLGRQLASRVSPRAVQKAFAVVLFAVSMGLLWQALDGITPK